MHVVHPHLPHLIRLSIAAAVSAIVISLVFVATISLPASTTSVARQSARAPTSSLARSAMPRWATDPFAGLLSRPLRQPWLTPRP